MRKRYDIITLERVLACCGIFIVHLGVLLNLSGSIRVISDFGREGVYVFFYISGFLLFAGKREKMKIYYLKRAIRILPLYLLVITVYYIEYVWILKDIKFDEYGMGWLRYFGGLNCIVPKSENEFWNNIGLTWTIFVFILFYLFAPVLRNVITSYKMAVFMQIVFVGIQRLYGINAVKWCWPLSFFLHFGLGVLVYCGVQFRKEKTTVVILCFGIILELVQKGDMHFVYSQIFSIITISLVNYEVKNSYIKKGIESLSKYTYTIYLVHGIYYEILSTILGRSIQITKIAILLIMVIATFITVIVVYNCYERRVSCLLYRLFRINIV